MAAIDFTYNYYTIRRVIQGYIYTLTTKIRTKEKTRNCLFVIVITENLPKFGG